MWKTLDYILGDRKMTDEEMADKYAQNLEKELMKEYEEHSEYGQTPYLATIPTPHVKQAFLAGLKAGRPQWHDLRKDPNDLPKDNNEVLVYMWDSYYIGYFNLDSWHFENFSEEKEQADAWCEIPTFDKETEKWLI
jgi:hypothetical protein